MADSQEPETEFASIRFGVVVEQSTMQRVRCEIREGQEIFVFDRGSETKIVVPVENYLKILKVAREHPVENTYGISNHELI